MSIQRYSAVALAFCALAISACDQASAPSASPSAAATTTAAATTASAGATASAATAPDARTETAQAVSVRSCDFRESRQSCAELIGANFTDARALEFCKTDPKAVYSDRTGCPKDDLLGTCTLSPGNPAEVRWHHYQAKGSKTAKAQEESCKAMQGTWQAP